MQILPLTTTSDTTSSELATPQSALGSRQAALFASLLSNYASATGTVSGSDQQNASTTADSGTNLLDAPNTPSQGELMRLPVTKEDIAALHDALQERGFSDTEIADLETKAASNTGMTWGDLMSTVNKKTAETKSSKKQEISTNDQAQLLGLFGKLGFTADQSQQLVDSLAKGNIDSVWNTVNAKIASLSNDSSVSLYSSEMSALAKSMNLSDSAQERLAKLFDQSSADQGLSGDGLKEAFSLVKNEHNADLAQESAAQEVFRKAASAVLTQAWQRSTTTKRSGIHEDDVARKAAQVVSMSGSTSRAKDAAGQTVTSAAKDKVDVLADVPKDGHGLDAATDQTANKATTAADGLTQISRTEDAAEQAARIGQPAATTLTGAAQAADEADADKTAKANTAKADTVKAKAKVQDETSATAADEADAARTVAGTQAAKDSGVTQAAQGQEKTAAPTTAAGAAASAFVKGQDNDGTVGGQSKQQAGQSNQEENWGAFWSKVTAESSSESTSAADLGQSAARSGLAAAMSGLKTQTANLSQTDVTPGLASRAANQLQSGLLRSLGQGSKQLVLNLQPDELGKLSVTLTVKGKEVQASITADNSDTAAMLQQQVSHIRQTLENQGFKVSKLDVQTGLAQDNQSAWQGAEQHNQAREQREAFERVRSSQRLAQFTDSGSFDVPQAAVIAESMTSGAQGLDLFA